MDKKKMGHPYNGMSLGLMRKAALTSATTWMNVEDMVLGEISQPPKDKCHVSPLNELLGHIHKYKK